MNNWQPTGEEKRYVECVASMALDSLQGRGVMDRETFAANLRAIANGLENVSEPVQQPEPNALQLGAEIRRLGLANI